ncbi:hypothetical protein [Ferruginibacter albus]|uniref:hypothetical protein n=1 Tax=Ferruginibacter albus TaxID=2875540 RepID=UPI001CC5C63B|nr:hypothetical protein [Ferruginibacter albus]UAY53296.1 hypothetical protein K9M53_06400 [Ferruginibacter albus]
MSTRTKGRIVYPRNAADMLALAKKMYEKHLADGNSSPLSVLQDYDWSVTGPTIAGCISNHEEAERLAKKAEELYKARDLAFPEISGIVKNSGSVLKGVYAKNPKKLGDYGLVVDDTPKIPKAKKPKE